MIVHKVLLVDSSKTMVNIIENIIKADNLAENIIVADSNVTAIEILLAHGDVDLVISEYHPPEIDGIKLALDIRANEQIKNTYIMIASKEGHKSVVVSAMEAGCNDYLVRPFNASVLVGKINHMLKLKTKNNS